MDQTPIDLSSLTEPTPRKTLRVLLATTWDEPCGISEHAFYLKQAVEAADPKIQIIPDPRALDPNRLDVLGVGGYDLLHLNYHAALHSRWTPEEIVRYPGKVITTYHDTGVPNSDRCKAVCHASDAAVVHEPFDDLDREVYYWRMGVPDWYGLLPALPYHLHSSTHPCLGTVGFPFPWKCYDELCRVTEKVGWALWIIAPRATPEQIQQWRQLNPRTAVTNHFTDRQMVISMLHHCDATAFTYVCHNTGQSGAILQGIAAKKPVFALSTCRQFRALYDDPLGRSAISWCETFEQLTNELSTMPLSRMDTGIVQLAHQDRWSEVGKKYSSLYRKVAAK